MSLFPITYSSNFNNDAALKLLNFPVFSYNLAGMPVFTILMVIATTLVLAIITIADVEPASVSGGKKKR